jgi:hypothetical protein
MKAVASESGSIPAGSTSPSLANAIHAASYGWQASLRVRETPALAFA